MAIATEQIVTQYVADASGHMRAVSQIKTSQEQLTKAVEDSGKAQAKAAGGAADALAKLQIGFGGLKGALDFVKGSWNELSQAQTLATASGAISITSMQTASAGLIEKMDLLKLAAAGQTGAFKLNQKQMDNVAGAVRALTRDGKDQTEVINKLTDAITKGTGQGLDDFGIMLDSTGDKTKDFTLLMDALEKKSNSVKNATLSQSEAMKQTGVTFADSMSKIRQSIGEIVVALQPLIGAIADLTSTAAGWISNITDFTNVMIDGAKAAMGSDSADARLRKRFTPTASAFEQWQMGGNTGTRADFEKLQAEFQLKWEKDRADAALGAHVIFDAGTNFRDGAKYLGQLIGAGAGMLKKPKKGGDGAASETWADIQYERDMEFAQSELDYQIKITAERRAQAELMAEWRASVDASANQAMNEQLDSAAAALTAMRDNLQEIATLNQQDSLITKLFGSSQEIDALTIAFDGLNGAVTASMDAWIGGSMGAGEAARKFAADYIGTQAKMMAVEALKFGAYAIGALAQGDLVHAPMYALTAAKFAAGAALAGVVAAGLGGSGGSGSSASGGNSSAPNTFSQPTQPSGAVIVYGDAFANDSPRMRQRNAQRLVALAHQDGQGARGN